MTERRADSPQTQDTAPPNRPETPARPRHGLVEDLLGLATGTFTASLGLYILHSTGTVTGGTAGLSLLLSYASSLPFGVMFLLVNSPFFVLSFWKKGWRFTARTIICVLIVSLMSPVHQALFGEIHANPVYGGIAGNVLAGIGLLILFRHNASLGGFNILALILQEKAGLRAGYVQMVLDLLVVLGSLLVVSLPLVAISALGAVILNLILALNHRPGRYTIT